MVLGWELGLSTFRFVIDASKLYFIYEVFRDYILFLLQKLLVKTEYNSVFSCPINQKFCGQHELSDAVFYFLGLIASQNFEKYFNLTVFHE